MPLRNKIGFRRKVEKRLREFSSIPMDKINFAFYLNLTRSLWCHRRRRHCYKSEQGDKLNGAIESDKNMIFV